MRVPLDRLSTDQATREDQLASYFGERVIECVQDGDGWRIDLLPFPSDDYYVDPDLCDGLRWWDAAATVEQVPDVFRDVDSWFLSLNDAWTLLPWSRWLQTAEKPDEIVIIHVDDHDDLMSPRLGIADSGMIDLVTGRAVAVSDPESIESAILSGAIGQGSFLVPFIHAFERVHLRHLCATGYSDSRMGHNRIELEQSVDTLLDPTAMRPSVRLDGTGQPGGSSYLVSRDAQQMVANLPDAAPIVVHIDLDYFNNRFNGDSDYMTNENRHDPPISEVKRMADDLLAALSTVSCRIVSVAVGISPGFFPAEYWQEMIDHLRPGLHELSVGGAA